MHRTTKPLLGLGAGLLLATPCAAQTPPSAAPSAQLRNGVLELSLEGRVWSQAIPFPALLRSPGAARRLQQSVVTAQEHMTPEGPTRSAKATRNARTWLQWGQGKTPLHIENWPYGLVEQNPNGVGATYQWVNADLSKKYQATPQRAVALRSGGALWCAWFSVEGQQASTPHTADGPTPTVQWMLWRKPDGAACR